MAKKFQVEVVNCQQSFTALEGCSLLMSMERSGTQAIKVGCRGGGCGMCKIRVMKGRYISKRMSRAHVSESDEQQGLVLACRVFPQEDLTIESDLIVDSVSEK
ncbi:2Fe-2S iron-sulfur cluster-binding protein [Neptunomonas japonica]|uniref:2Fe-2S iron-sulfur cluster-binding protein n=1 Tax=Neptunomonas japonica TaxID=417574 RepID=UPI000403E20B|nr:2Fe-2S iron-sulfur cluster-binding protein [Neptunomonas japonica]